MMYGYRNWGNNGCFGLELFNNGWDLLIGIGILLIVTVVTYLLINKNRNLVTRDNVMESLKMKYVQGEITQEEYDKRRNVLNRK